MSRGAVASQLSPGPGDVCDSRSRRDAAQMLDLRAGVPNVTCVREIEIKRIASFSTSLPLRFAILFSLARASDVWDGHSHTGPLGAAPAAAAGILP